jgi:tRNA threonylcarbamoyladenosine biosynthesis protein TsaE
MSLPGRDALLRVPFLLCASPEETQALGVRFAAALEQGAVLSLEGPLGAGKTQFVKGFATALGHAGEVSSPTFTLVHEYMGGKSPLVHFDWYRLDEINGVIGLGWDDYLTCGETLLVEWGDKFVELLPAGTWRVRFEIRDTARFVKWERMP